MQKALPKYIALIFCSWFSTLSHATHIVGGEVLYHHLGNDRYEVKLHLFIDCLNGNPGAISQDATAYFYVFSKSTGQLLPGFPISVARSVPERIVKLNYNCLANAPNACVDFYVYDTLLTLPSGIGGYIISFQRCCRNNSLSNLQNPGAQGANYWTTIPDTSDIPNRVQNSGAYFNQLPPNFLCTNAFLEFDHSATDTDGDSLAYDLFWPYHGGTVAQPRPDNGLNGIPQNPPFTQVTWLAGYDESNPIDGSPSLNIDPLTGKLTLLPTKTGQFVAGIRVKEYRNGQLIAETRRDYQFNVSDCDLTLLAGPAGNQRLCSNGVILQNNSVGAQRYSWDFGISDRGDDTSNLKNPQFQFPSKGIYKVKLKVFKNNCQDSAISEIRIGEKSGGTAEIKTDNCSKEVFFSATTSAPVTEWTLDNETVLGKEWKRTLPSGVHSAQVIFVDTIAGCNDTIVQSFELSDNLNDMRLANVFTPNDDGKNDCYHVAGEMGNCSEGKVKIFNRWGELVFYSEDLQSCWNGRVNNTGPYLPEGAYFYLIAWWDSRGNGDKDVHSVSGSIELIR